MEMEVGRLPGLICPLGEDEGCPTEEKKKRRRRDPSLPSGVDSSSSMVVLTCPSRHRQHLRALLLQSAASFLRSGRRVLYVRPEPFERPLTPRPVHGMKAFSALEASEGNLRNWKFSNDLSRSSSPLQLKDSALFCRFRLAHLRDHEELTHWMAGVVAASSQASGGSAKGFSLPDLLVVEDVGGYSAGADGTLVEPRLCRILSSLASVARRDSGQGRKEESPVLLLLGLSSEAVPQSLLKKLDLWARETWKILEVGGSVDLTRELSDGRGRVSLRMRVGKDGREYFPMRLERETTEEGEEESETTVRRKGE